MKVLIKETLERVVEVKSEKEAIDLYTSNKIELLPEHLTSVEIRELGEDEQ